MDLLKADLCEEDILAELRPVFYEAPPVKTEILPNKLQQTAAGVINHPKGCHYFVSTLYKRFVAELGLSSRLSQFAITSITIF
jgi:hypothetical protein